MATELGSAYISVGLGTNSLAGDIKKSFAGAETSGKSAGAGAGRGFLTGFKGLVGAGLAVAGAGVFGGFIAEAARASDATDKFKASMNFAGLDTSAIDTAAKAAKAYADQTVYDLPTIQNTLAQLASNGVKDYTGLTKAAGNLNAVAGGNAETFGSVAMVMTQTAGAGKLTTENWNQLADAIPGAAGPLMKALEGAGAYTGNFRDAMAKGQITSEEFNTALSKLGNDPVAVEAAKSTDTFEGSIGNLTATINSGLMGALDALKPGITGVINGVADGIGVVNGAIGGIFELFKTGNFNADIGKALGVDESSKVVGVILGIRDGVVGAFDGVKSVLSGIDFAGIFGGLASILGPLVAQVVPLVSAFSPLQVIFNAIEPLLPQLFDMFGQLASVLGGSLLTMLTALTPMFVELSGVVSDALGGVLAAVLPTVVTMVTMLGTTLSQLIPIIVPIIGTLVQLATTLISQLMPIITDLVTSIMPPLVDIFGNILSAIGPVISMIAGVLIPIIMALMPVVVTVFGVIANVIKSAMQIVQGIIQVVTGIITGNWSQVWNGLGNIVSGALATVGNVLGGLFDIVMSALGGIGGWLVDSGKALIQGFIDGIGGMVGAIGDAVGGVLGAVADFFPHSPAKKGPFSGRGYTTYSGAALASDFATSIEGQRSRVASAAASVTGAAVLSGSMIPAGATVGGGAATPSAGHPGVVQNIYPQPGMSEETIGNVAANRMNYNLRMAGA